MKKLALLVLFVLSSASVAGATPFSDTKDFTGAYFTADGIEKDGIFINDTGNTLDPGAPGYVFAYTDTHNVSFNPAAASVNSAFLDVTFTGNQDNLVEAWFIYDQTYLDDTQDTEWITERRYISLGRFGGFYVNTEVPVQDYDWATQTFDLTDIVAGVSGSNWSVAFSIDENTLGEDEQLFLAESTLRGEYEPVPEPATMLLFGTGLLGLIGYNRRRFNKKA